MKAMESIKSLNASSDSFSTSNIAMISRVRLRRIPARLELDLAFPHAEEGDFRLGFECRKASDRLAGLTDHDFLAVADGRDQLGKLALRLMRVDVLHG